jgi:hypothetical protein
MKKIFINLTILSIIQLSAQEVSCIEFVSMSDNDANRYLSQFKKNIEIISNDTIKGRKKYLDKNYQKTSHLYKCILLRKAKHSNIEDFKRVKSLAELNKKRLTIEEKRLYDELVSENKSHFSSISRASLVSNNVCNYPLIYLSYQLTDKGLLIYEKRVVNNKIKTFNRYVNPRNSKMQCGDTIGTQNNYLRYLNRNGASIPLIVRKNNLNKTPDIYNMLQKKQQQHKKKEVYRLPKQQEKEIDMDNMFKKKFITIKQFKARNFSTGKIKIFKKGTEVLSEGDMAENNDPLIIYKGVTYRVTPHTWKKYFKEK